MYKAAKYVHENIFALFQSNSSGQLIFPPVSPSPAGGAFFGQDLSGIDFASAIFGTTAEPGQGRYLETCRHFRHNKLSVATFVFYCIHNLGTYKYIYAQICTLHCHFINQKY
jgi:hypothetical protein